MKKISFGLCFYFLALIILSLWPVKAAILSKVPYIGRVRVDFLIHALLFIPMAFLLSFLKHKGGILVVVLGLAILFEGIHLAVPYRSFNLMDMAANLAGAAFGYLLWIISCWKNNRQNTFKS